MPAIPDFKLPGLPGGLPPVLTPPYPPAFPAAQPKPKGPIVHPPGLGEPAPGKPGWIPPFINPDWPAEDLLPFQPPFALPIPGLKPVDIPGIGAVPEWIPWLFPGLKPKDPPPLAGDPNSPTPFVIPGLTPGQVYSVQIVGLRHIAFTRAGVLIAGSSYQGFALATAPVTVTLPRAPQFGNYDRAKWDINGVGGDWGIGGTELAVVVGGGGQPNKPIDLGPPAPVKYPAPVNPPVIQGPIVPVPAPLPVPIGPVPLPVIIPALLPWLLPYLLPYLPLPGKPGFPSLPVPVPYPVPPEYYPVPDPLAPFPQPPAPLVPFDPPGLPALPSAPSLPSLPGDSPGPGPGGSPDTGGEPGGEPGDDGQGEEPGEDDCFQSPCHQEIMRSLRKLEEICSQEDGADIENRLIRLVECSEGQHQESAILLKVEKDSLSESTIEKLNAMADLAIKGCGVEESPPLGEWSAFYEHQFSLPHLVHESPPLPPGVKAISIRFTQAGVNSGNFKLGADGVNQGRYGIFFWVTAAEGEKLVGQPQHLYYSNTIHYPGDDELNPTHVVVSSVVGSRISVRVMT